MSKIVPAPRFPTRDEQIPPFLDWLGLSGIVDIHVHALPRRLQQAVWRFFDDLEDPPWPIRYRFEQAELLDTLRRIGVESHTALAYAHKPGMLGWLNDYTLGLAAEYPQVIPTFTIYPEADVADTTATAIARGGAVVKVHLQVGRFHATDRRLDEAWRLIADARLPVVLHASAVYGVDGGGQYCGADGVKDLLERHPDLTLVIAHLGMPQHEGFLALAESHSDVFLDVSMTLVGEIFHEVADEQLLERIARLQPQLLFGSDYPSIPHSYARQIRGLAQLGFTREQLKDVLAGTARRILDQRRAR